MRQKAPLEALRKQLSTSDGAAFAQKAKEVSEDPVTKPIGGDLGPQAKDDLTKRIGPVAANAGWLLVRVGELSAVVEGEKGFHLLRLAGREGAVQVDFEMAKESIRSRLWYARRDQAIQKFDQDVRSKLKVEIDAPAVEAVVREVAH